MKLKVVRKIFTEKSTIGELFIDDKFECYTLEDKVREIEGKEVSTWKIAGTTAIPYGLYKLILDFSNRFKTIMPHILDVPGFEGIRIHSGNLAQHTEGCLLVGNTKSVDSIGVSKVAFEQLFTKLQVTFNAKEDITILYTKEQETKKEEKQEVKEQVKENVQVVTTPVQPTTQKSNVFLDILQAILSLFKSK